MSTPKSQFLDTIGLSKLWDKMCDTFPSRTGDGATGTWNININGNAATATTATHADTSDNASNSDKLAGKTPDKYVLKSDIPVPIIINYNTIKDAANSEVNTISEQTWLKYIANDTYKNYDWIIQRDGIKYNCTVIPDYDNEHIQILYFTRNEIEGTSGPLGNAIMKYSGLRIQLLPYTENTYLIYKISNGGSLETREFVFGEDYNKNAYLIAAAQMSGIDTIDCKWVYTTKADETITVNGQYFHIENSITNVDAIFSVKDKSLTYVDGNGLINKVTFADNGSYDISKNNPDWNASEGEVGYIKNRPFGKLKVNGEIFDVSQNPLIRNIHYFIPYDPSIIDFDPSKKIDYIRVYWVDNDVVWIDETIKIPNDYITSVQTIKCVSETPLGSFNLDFEKTESEIRVYLTAQEELFSVSAESVLERIVVESITYLSDEYLPDTVLKTTPQTFSELEKKQVLTNLGLLEDEDTELPIINTTYSNLVSLVGSSALKVGQRYRITDYSTAVVDADAAGHRFDIVVTAINSNTLDENAKAVHSESDSYFDGCDLDAWEIKYCLNNDTDRFDWVDDIAGRGVIYYMKDEWGNEAPYDFKNILFFAAGDYLYTFGGLNDDSLTGNSRHNVIKSPIDTGTWSIQLNWFGTNCRNNTLGLGCRNITFRDNCYNNTLGVYCENNTFGNNCYNNTFGDECYDNTLGDYCYDNTFGVGCCNNTFGDSCFYNIFGNQCGNNTFGYGCHNNTFGYYFDNNTFGDGCFSNTFEVECCDNTFGVGCCNNTFGDSCFYNTFGEYCSNNTFGDSCYNNTFGDECYDNTFEYYCTVNTFENYCSGNIFGYECCDNTFGDSCNNNTFGDSCSNNTFGDSCHNNTFGEYCYNNTFGDSCYNNTFGVDYCDNTFGNGCYNNTFGDSCYNNTFGVDYCDNTFGNGCSNNTFGDSCNYNTFEDECSNNTFDNECSNNTFGGGCYNNTFDNECSNNTFGGGCYNNAFGNGCNDNTFGNICAKNSFNEMCDHNTFGVNCASNFLPSESCYNEFENNCVFVKIDDGWGLMPLSYSKIDSGVSYLDVYNESETYNTLKNIHIRRGVKGTSVNNLLRVEITNYNADYETIVARNSKGELKIYCEADLIA